MSPDSYLRDTLLDASLLTEASPWGHPVRVLAETTSSNDELLRLGDLDGDGGLGTPRAPHGTLLFAERQTAGRGRFRRAWASGEPLGLWFSLLLRMEINDFTLPSLSAFAAVALAEALGELGFIDAKIKAPNDLYLEGRKVAGILIETRPGKNPFAVVGIGLNVNQHRDDFPPELQDRATSLAIATGRVFDRNEIAVPVLRCLGRKERQIRENPTAILASWNSLLIDPAAVVQAPA